MTRITDWASKVLALLKSGNAPAAIAQIKVAPSVKDLRSLQAAMGAAGYTCRFREVDAGITDNIALLAAPRLHRSP